MKNYIRALIMFCLCFNYCFH